MDKVKKSEFLKNVFFEFGDEAEFFEKNKDSIVCFRDDNNKPLYFQKTEVLGFVVLDAIQRYIEVPASMIEDMNKEGFNYVMGEYMGEALYPIDHKTSFGGEYRFLEYSGDVYATNPSAGEAFKKAYKAMVFPEYDATKVEFTVVDGEELRHHIATTRIGTGDLNVLSYKKENGNYAYIGMDYFCSPYEHMDKKVEYLFAVLKGRIIGVICYGVFGNGPFSMSYINVSAPYRRKGLAEHLVQKFASVISDQKQIYVTRESEMGHECHMHDLFRKYLSIKMVTD